MTSAFRTNPYGSHGGWNVAGTYRCPGSGVTEARGINDHGDIVGLWMDEQGSIHGYVRTTRSFTEITLPIASTVAVNAINNPSQIVGGFTDLGDPSGAGHGFEMRINVH